MKAVHSFILLIFCGAILAYQELLPWVSLQHIFTLMSIVFVAFTSIVALVHLIALYYARYKLHKPVRVLTKYEGVSILKPLVGVDPNLESNLKTFFQINYPKFELLFCIHDDKDEAIPIVKRLMKEFPKIDAQLFIGGEQVGLNPKINNMMPGYRKSKHPLILISDSRMRIREDTLTDVVSYMDERTGLVSQVPFSCDIYEWAPSLEQMFFGTACARTFLASYAVNFCATTGMSQLIKKKALEDCGGLARFEEFLAEDFFIGADLAKKGWKRALAATPALQNDRSVTIESFEARICRWIQLRKAMTPDLTVFEPFQEWLLNCILFSLSMWNIAGVHPLVVSVVHTLFWFSCDYNLFKHVHGRPMPFTRFLPLWLTRELITYRIYQKALCKRDISWRKGTFRWVDQRWEYVVGNTLAPASSQPSFHSQ